MTAVTDAIAALDQFIEVAHVRRKEALTAPYEAQLAADLRVAFKRQERAFLRRLDTIADQFEALESIQRRAARPHAWLAEAAEPRWEQLWLEALEETREDFEKPIAEASAAVYQLAAEKISTSFKGALAFDLANPRAVDYITNRAPVAVSQINETTRRDVRRIITAGVNEGKSYQAVAKELREKYAQFRTPRPQEHIRDRAEGIAVFEMGDAYEQSSHDFAQGMQDWGMEMQKGWLSVGDAKVRPEHTANQAQGWIGLNEEFQSGHQRPPTDPGCRCTSLHRRKPTT